MKAWWAVIFLSGCVSNCHPWIPTPPDQIIPTQANPADHLLIDELPDFSLGIKCRY